MDKLQDLLDLHTESLIQYSYPVNIKVKSLTNTIIKLLILYCLAIAIIANVFK